MRSCAWPRRNRILVNLDVSAPTTERFYFMGFINFIAELLKDPRTAIAGWIAAGPLMAYGCVFLIIFIETGVVFFPFLPGDSLLFATRKLRGEVVQAMRQANLPHNLGCIKRIAADLRGKLDILERSEVLDEVVKLEHEADIVATIQSKVSLAKAADLAPIKENLA